MFLWRNKQNNPLIIIKYRHLFCWCLALKVLQLGHYVNDVAITHEGYLLKDFMLLCNRNCFLLCYYRLNKIGQVKLQKQLIAVAWKGPLEGLNAPTFELGKIQKWCWYRFVQIRRYWTEFGLVCVEFYGPVNNEVMSSRSVNSGTVPGQA